MSKNRQGGGEKDERGLFYTDIRADEDDQILLLRHWLLVPSSFFYSHHHAPHLFLYIKAIRLFSYYTLEERFSRNMISSSKPTVSVPEPFYSNASFYRFVPLSLAYTLVAHFASLLMKPFPCRLSIAPEFPQDRFTIAPRKKSFPAALTEESNESNYNNQGPLAIVSGSNSGIGFETSASLASLGYTVILACRSKNKAKEAVEKINKRIESMSDKGSARGKAVFLAPLDLSSIESVKSFSEAFNEKYSHLNVLVNNA